ncbi:PspC domain-containing protein [Salinisphaera sp. G21_0]|uniref:PspC domain-containing protein n=1 Tax=Salinisphaera sp. G21_0 TaxID=2821094 RepID=UPI001ADD3D45|nr:PspC domain-containing protein [Salinisphaera sp. G21_0]MBO9483008.1 PspC domain-containing protein [Salinisphaera sp. G21_0]
MRVIRKIFTQQKEGEASPAIMGVCSYIANRFHLDVLAVRLSAAGIAYFTSTSRAILAYIAIGVVLSISSGKDTYRGRRVKKIKVDVNSESAEQNDDALINDKETAPGLSKTSVSQLARKVTRLESRLSRVEDSVTSNHLKFAREFRDLQSSEKPARQES